MDWYGMYMCIYIYIYVFVLCIMGVSWGGNVYLYNGDLPSGKPTRTNITRENHYLIIDTLSTHRELMGIIYRLGHMIYQHGKF